ncbi:hypothetical protein [Nonomuraea salmonea]|uniref:hypothetical protein n=1 Tax=Nonomuraea salmonea TaxID=46181 RepID=UPI0031EA01A8
MLLDRLDLLLRGGASDRYGILSRSASGSMASAELENTGPISASISPLIWL